ncbi:UNVERIFIED_CONTAM: hypothetical protein ABID98_005564 [Brevibacillus sp. OAP136]
MNHRVSKVAAMLLCICLLLSACSEGTAGEKSKANSYYPVNETHAVKYSFPNRPFDLDVTLEGYGWQNGKFYLVFHSKDIIGKSYSPVSKRLAPRVLVGGKAVTLSDFLWEEGAREVYNESVYRYACTVKKAEMIPEGTIPDEIHLDNANFVLEKTPPAAEVLNATVMMEEEDRQLQGSVTIDGRIYAPTQLLVTADKRELTLTVTSQREGKESRNRRFLLMDDKKRIYTFTDASLPDTFAAGTNTFSLQIVEQLPKDTTGLQLVIADVELVQSDLYSILAEQKLPVQ